MDWPSSKAEIGRFEFWRAAVPESHELMQSPSIRSHAECEVCLYKPHPQAIKTNKKMSGVWRE